MKIVDVCEFYTEAGGGVRRYVDKKLELAASCGHELTIVAPGAENKIEKREGGKIVWLESPPLPVDPNYRMFWRAADVWRVLDAEAPDVVEGSSPWRGGWLAGHWRGNALKSFVFHQDFVAAYGHTFLDRVLTRRAIDQLFFWYWRYLRRLSARYDTTVVGGAWLADRLKQAGVNHPVAIPFGVERDCFSQAKRDEDLRQELLGRCHVSGDGHLLLAVSRLHPEKRVRTIIEGFEIAKRQRPLGLVIVGHGVLRSALTRRALIAGNVLMAGEIRDRDLLASHYASADLFLHGCATETYGLAVAEALASGLPVVVPDGGGAAALAVPGYSQLYATGDANACAAAILESLVRLTRINETEARARAASAVGFLDDHFTTLLALYQKLIREKNGHSKPNQKSTQSPKAPATPLRTLIVCRP